MLFLAGIYRDLFFTFDKPLFKMATISLTIPKYAKQLRPKKSRIAVYKAVIKDKRHLLPNVVSITKVGRDYILEVAV